MIATNIEILVEQRANNTIWSKFCIYQWIALSVFNCCFIVLIVCHYIKTLGTFSSYANKIWLFLAIKFNEITNRFITNNKNGRIRNYFCCCVILFLNCIFLIDKYELKRNRTFELTSVLNQTLIADVNIWMMGECGI